MKARNKETGEIVELYFQQGDHQRECCYASDFKQEDYGLPEARTENYELIEDING